MELLDYLSDMYYRGSPVVSDAEFDILCAAYNYGAVGHKITDGVPHFIRMYSLQKVFTDKEVSDFSEGRTVIKTPKLDGAAVSLLYGGGTLLLALTRGDGNLGRDVTDKFLSLVPQCISYTDKLVQITGEVVAPKEIPNSRNFAAGSLNLKDVNEFYSRPLTFVAYDLQTEGEPEKETYFDTLNLLEELGFQSALGKGLEDEFPTDGEVFRINSSTLYYNMGFTAHHPRGSVARKDLKEGVLSRLLDVVWQVGKSGVVSPVAILEPVNINDATVSRATLHNIQYIRALNLELGCQVEVIRSGEVIPRIVRRVD
jgi:DNA ligase (NAD+)